MEEAEPIEPLDNRFAPSEMPKGIMVDETEYFPIHEDWALGYFECGGEA